MLNWKCLIITNIWNSGTDSVKQVLISNYQKNPMKIRIIHEIYSRLHGMDEERMYWNGPRVPLFYDSKYNICIFNKWKMDKRLGKWLGIDDDAYNGFEKYWSN